MPTRWTVLSQLYRTTKFKTMTSMTLVLSLIFMTYQTQSWKNCTTTWCSVCSNKPISFNSLKLPTCNLITSSSIWNKQTTWKVLDWCSNRLTLTISSSSRCSTHTKALMQCMKESLSQTSKVDMLTMACKTSVNKKSRNGLLLFIKSIN